ncbi:MAG TPA: TIGR04190 family B12-binding domain/radical SAM domain protein [Symbiobacteriaceae bacterium]|nr:TIGR04190 family B12-binding domain/radical SAM domain protein [Symbiobacteriaceae bacterium]
MPDFTRRDVIFLHAPSVYDFRKDTKLFGPVSDVVPSSSVFEMYPVGITSIADRLERAGYHVQLINVAYRMLRDPKYNPEEQIRQLNPRLWAIDLHWLPHAHGALALAELIKKHHPDAPVLMGGLSASYYHEELIASPYVDFVIRGDSTEEPVLDLVRRLRTGRPLDGVPNLTWKQQSGDAVVNPLSHVPDSLDYADLPAYRYSMRSVFKYWNLHNMVPYLRWLEYPMTALLISRGCTQSCSICGGSRAAYKQLCNRSKPAFRSPDRLAEDVRFIARFSRAPIFVIHDLRMGGSDYFHSVMAELKDLHVDNEIVLELFTHADDAFFAEVQQSIPRYSLELTLESHDEGLRRLNGKFPITNAEVESTIASALAHGCHRLDIYFMVGIPRQTSESVMASMEYARHLLERFGAKLQIYVAPLAPFLDPGSLAFEDPAAYGYKLRAHTLEEHRARLTEPTWAQILNYESEAMPADAIADTTYEATARLTQIKLDLGLEKPEAGRRTLALIAAARDLMKRMGAASRLPEPERTAAMGALQAEAREVNGRRVYQQTDFVSWGGRRWQLRLLGLAGLMVELFFEELSLAWLRWTRRAWDWHASRQTSLPESSD